MGGVWVSATKEDGMVSLTAEDVAEFAENAISQTYTCQWEREIEKDVSLGGHGVDKSVCHAQLNCRQAFHKHLLVHCKSVKCHKNAHGKCCWGDCPSKFASKKDLENHVLCDHANDLICPVKGCGLGISSGSAYTTLKAHFREKHLLNGLSQQAILRTSAYSKALPDTPPKLIRPPTLPKFHFENGPERQQYTYLYPVCLAPFAQTPVLEWRPSTPVTHERMSVKLESPVKMALGSQRSPSPTSDIHLEDLPPAPPESFWNPRPNNLDPHALTSGLAMSRKRPIEEVDEADFEVAEDDMDMDLISAPPPPTKKHQTIPKPQPRTIHMDIFRLRVEQFEESGGLSGSRSNLDQPPPLRS